MVQYDPILQRCIFSLSTQSHQHGFRKWSTCAAVHDDCVFCEVYRVGVWFGFISLALLLAIILCWVHRWFDSWVLLGLFCPLRVTHSRAVVLYFRNGGK